MFREYRKGFVFGAVFGIVVTFSLITVARYFGIQLYISGAASQQIYDKSKVIETCIEKYYQGEYSDEDLSNGAAIGMVSALGDKYSRYYTKEEYDELMNGINGSYVGIGVILQQGPDRMIRAVDVMEGEPAERAGMKKNDRLLRIDGTDITEMSLDEVVSMVRKEVNDGKTIMIAVERTGDNGEKKEVELSIVCGRVNVVSVTSKKFENIGYVKVSKFDKETDEQFGAAIENMKKDQVNGLVIDVRDNGGGSLDSVLAMLDQLLPEGELITEKSKKEGNHTFYSTNTTSYDQPVAVLINGSSASASEVFAGTLQARGAAVLVGTQSFGKGVVQTVISLQKSCGGALKLTTAEYFLPGDVSIHQKGLTPDVVLEYEGAEGAYDENKDNQLQKAIEIVQDKLTEKEQK